MAFPIKENVLQELHVDEDPCLSGSFKTDALLLMENNFEIGASMSVNKTIEKATTR